MPFQIIEKDLDAVLCDAVVDIAAESWSGADLLEETAAIGERDLTRTWRKNSRYRIHAPYFPGEGGADDPERIRLCYRRALQIAEDRDLRSVALPLIGSETETFPKELALEIASEEIRRHLKDNADTEIILAVRDRRDFRPAASLLSGLSDYIRVIERQKKREEVREDMLDMASTCSFPAFTEEDLRFESAAIVSPPPPPPPPECAPAPGRRRNRFSWPRQPRKGAVLKDKTAGPSASGAETVLSFDSFLPERGAVLDESFSQMVMRKIGEKGYEKDSDCYGRANIDRRLFSRIRCDTDYHPKKATALALAIALELPLEETRELLMKAGYSLSHSIMSDVIVEYCILNGNYDILSINELLFKYGQPLLGG